jgi:hypothetical protein
MLYIGRVTATSSKVIGIKINSKIAGPSGLAVISLQKGDSF